MKLIFLLYLYEFTAFGAVLAAKNLVECVKMYGKWDYKTNVCSQGRDWRTLTPELKKGLQRSLNSEELKKVKAFIGMQRRRTFAAGGKAKAVILVGAGASGKSHLAKRISHFLPLDFEDFVFLDGDVIRNFHQGFQLVVKEPLVGYLGAWKVIKEYSDDKLDLLRELIANKQNVIVNTVVNGSDYYELFLDSGYEVYIFGVFVDYKVSKFRGLNRAHWTGKEYNPSRERWLKAAQDMLLLARDERTHGAVVVDNNDFSEVKTLDLSSHQLPDVH